MENENNNVDFNLDALMQEFHDIAAAPDPAPAEQEAIAPAVEDPPVEIADEISEGSVVDIGVELAFQEAAAEPEAPSTSEAIISELMPEEEGDKSSVSLVKEPSSDDAPAEEPEKEEPPAEPVLKAAPSDTPAESTPSQRQASKILRLRDLKKKIVAGPEKEYYNLNGMGLGKLQIGILCNVIILVLACVAVTLFTLGKVPESRTKLMIFSQALALLVSGLLGCNLMIDGVTDLFRLRYSMNTTLVITFLACCADAWFCFEELRVPCCGAFVLEMTAAMLARYHKRSTEMSQMDTLRKASSLTSLVKEPRFYDKRAGILRGQGDVEDFMDTYARPSGPEIVQRVFAFVALISSIGIAVLAGLLHGIPMAVQIFAIAMLVTVPASYFASLTRPTYLLEKRLHMVGTVICGWQGVKKLCGKAVFPLRDKDLFPRGSTKLNGIKFYSERAATETVSYTASLLFASGSGLTPLFRNLLSSRNGVEYSVENYRDYGVGGIGGEVNGESVLMGTQEFLQSMGVEIPKGNMVSQAIYVAIDLELAAVVAISYSKMRSAAAGMVSLCSCWKLRPMLLAGDFMLTDSFIRSKFSIRTRRLITPAKEQRAALAAQKADPDADVLALVTRDDLISSAYAVTGSMALRNACRVGSVIHILGGVAGISIMLALAYLGYTELLTPARVLLYQVIWMVPGFFASEWTRTV